MRRLIARVAAAVLATAAAYAVAPAAPAAAAGCPTATGVTVVVDFHDLGGGVQTACVADGGGDTAADLFTTAGFPLTYVQRQPSFVCRVAGKPADNPCANTPPTDAYWALFWSDGKSGSWNYSTTAAGGQHVPDGGYVAFSWNGSEGRTAPGYPPARHPSSSPSPTSTPAPTHAAGPSHADSPAASSAAPARGPSQPPSDSPSASPSQSSSAAKSGHPRHSREPNRKPRASGSPTPTSTTGATPSAAPSLMPASSDPADPGGAGMPGWVGPVVILLLFGAAGAAAIVRRRRGAA